MPELQLRPDCDRATAQLYCDSISNRGSRMIARWSHCRGTRIALVTNALRVYQVRQKSHPVKLLLLQSPIFPPPLRIHRSR